LTENKPILSVLILTYNHVKYIEQAILSVVQQKTNYSFEILIGDDHSTDGTTDIVETLEKSYPDLIKIIKEHKNLGAIRNEANLLKNAKGKYIAFLEGDDFWTNENKIEMQISFLENNPDYGLVHTDVNHFFEYSNSTVFDVNKANNVQVPKDNIFKALMSVDPFFIMTATTCFRADIAKKHFNYQLAIDQNWPLTDLPLWFDITFHSKVQYIESVTATYRLLNESASRTKSLKKRYAYIQKLQEIKEHYFEKYKVDTETTFAIRERYYKNVFKYAFRLKDIETLKKCKKYFSENNIKLNFKEKIIRSLSVFIK
jgi:glycosyltransferase involved in cell wall biosynthesis